MFLYLIDKEDLNRFIHKLYISVTAGLRGQCSLNTEQTEHSAPTSGSEPQLHSEPPQMKIADDFKQSI